MRATTRHKHWASILTRVAALVLVILYTPHSIATIWQVGPDQALKTPSAAAKRARPGDTVEIDAGTYRNDYAVWYRDNITIRGLGSGAHLQSSRLIPNGKAIWIVRGRNIVIENVEFSGARVTHGNGAGIRQNGGSLTLRNTYFHHNEFAILTSNRADASLTIEDSRFAHHSRVNGMTHGIYVGRIDKFVLTGSHVTATGGGHHVKSRASENHILYNRLEDNTEVPTSRLIDLSNCGLSYIIGNELLQAKDTRNINAIGYGPEKCDKRTARQKTLFVVNNTLINGAFNGVLVRNHADTEVTVANNLIIGPGRFLSGGGEASNNIKLGTDRLQDDMWLPAPDSAVADAAEIVKDEDGTPLTPQRQFSPPAGTVQRKPHGALDIGARELAP